MATIDTQPYRRTHQSVMNKVDGQITVMFHREEAVVIDGNPYFRNRGVFVFKSEDLPAIPISGDRIITGQQIWDWMQSFSQTKDPGVRWTQTATVLTKRGQDYGVMLSRINDNDPEDTAMLSYKFNEIYYDSASDLNGNIWTAADIGEAITIVSDMVDP